MVAAGIGVFVLLLLLLGYFVWPTPWRTWKSADGSVHRVPRLGGSEKEDFGGGWCPETLARPENKGKPTPQEQP